VITSLLDYFEEELFLPELKSTRRDEALAEMVALLVEHRRVRDGQILLEMLKQREELGSTGIGRGVAVPHGRSLAVGRLTLVVARSQAGIEFDSMDGKPVHLVFLTVAPPQDRANLYLPVLGKIVELVKSARTRKKLLAAPAFKEFTDILGEVDDDE
jgi:PTS system nitrogen regulatory IIA component